MSQKIESVHFYSCPQAKLSSRFLSSPLQVEGNYPLSLNIFWKSIFPQQKGGRIIEPTKWPKLNLRGYWSHVLINSTIFSTLKILISVLLCHNLDSSFLKCKGSLKVVSATFLQVYFLSLKESTGKTMENVFISRQKLFLFIKKLYETLNLATSFRPF